MHIDEVYRLTQKYIQSIPFYNRDPRYIDAHSFFDIPILSKDVLVNSLSEFDLTSLDLLTTRTSGSSGIVVDIYWNSVEYLRSLSYLWRIRRIYDIYPYHKYCTTHVNFHINDRIINSKIVINKNMLSLSKNFIDEQSLAAYVAQLEAFQPRWLLVPASFLYSLKVYLDQSGLALPASIKMIELNGEYCSASMMRDFIYHFPNIQINNMYGMQECNGIAYGDSELLNIISDNVYVEVLDDKDLSCPVNQEGEIVITTLHNSVMPLIRYRTGDCGRLVDKDTLIITKARSNDSFVINGIEYDGSLCWDAIDYVNTYIVNNAVLQFQVIFESNHFTFQVKLNADSENAFVCELIKSSIREYMYTKFGWTNIIVDVVSVSEIHVSHNSNKIKYFINKS